MRYLGGKSRLARRIVDAIETDGGLSRVVWDPFCGGGAIAAAFARRGWRPPETLTESEYAHARELPDSDPLKAFAAFGVSFGGKAWGGFARGGDRDFAAEARRNLARDFDRAIERCTFRRVDYRSIAPQPGDVVYYDPPYAGTTGYGATAPFDHAEFWAHCREVARRGVRVYVSEFEAPTWAEEIWRVERAQTTSFVRGSGRARAVDRLFKVVAC